MWIRCGCIHTKFILMAPLFVASFLAVYFLLELMKQIFDETRDERFEMRDRRRSPHMVIAQYIGTGHLMGPLTQEFVDQNNFSPISNEGENGKAVVIPPREILIMQQQFKINSYNLLASDRMPLNRTLPDVRKKRCLLKLYDNLPTTSVIIVFHNEAWSVLLRTVWSVINRSPRHLLKEILLVDDASTRTFLRDPLESYVGALPVHTKVIRLKKRKGIIPARLLGAEKATGGVLTFLDAHCECTIGWLEPLLFRVKENPSNVVCPVIDIISDKNFGYIKSFELHWGAFNWQLHFRWYLMNSKELNKRKTDVTQPFPTPAMAGGLFSIDRDYFFKIGSYDNQMKIWGGDNLEMSFRIWQCGGQIEIIPCSHVGHLFRKNSPYTFPGGVNNMLNINLARTALVWMDDWSDFFIKFVQIPRTIVNSLDLEERKLLRKNLQCKSFEWYLENIWPDNFFPSSKRFFGKITFLHENLKHYETYRTIIKDADSTKMSNWTYIGNFMNSRVLSFQKLISQTAMLCLKQPPNLLNMPSGLVNVGECGNDIYMNEIFVAREDGHLMGNEGICLDSLDSSHNGKNTSIVRVVNCADTPRQLWSYNLKTQQIMQLKSNHCLSVSDEPADQESYDNRIVAEKSDSIQSNQKKNKGKQINLRVHAEPCSTSKSQIWMLIPFAWK